MQLESGAKLIHLVLRIIMRLSDEKLLLNYDNSVTSFELSHEIWAKSSTKTIAWNRLFCSTSHRA